MHDEAVMTFTSDGTAHCLYHEAIDLRTLGVLEIRRASEVEFNPATQVWEVRTPGAPQTVLFSHRSRQECLDWERQNLSAV